MSETAQLEEPWATGVHSFGNNPDFPVTYMKMTHEGPFTSGEPVVIPRSFRYRPGLYEQACRDIGKTAKILDGDSVSLEIAFANIDAINDEEYVAHCSTGSSGLWSNELQAAEHALRASGSSERYLYISAAGQGGSSDWSEDEKAHIKDTGSYLQEDGTPLPSVIEKQALLDENDYKITKFSCDADGCSLAIGLAMAMEPGQLSHSHFNSPPIIDTSGIAVIKNEIVNQYDDFVNDRVTKDRARVTKEMAAEAQAALPERPRTVPAQSTKLQQAVTTHTPSKLATVAAGLGRRAEAGSVHPAVLETAFLTKRHPEAQILFQIVQRAMAASQLEDFLGAVHAYNPHASHVAAVYFPATRRMHKAFPSLRESVRKYAFSE